MPPTGPLTFAQIAATGAVIVVTMAGVALSATPHGEFAVAVFPPWWGAHQSILAAASAGEIVSAGQSSIVVVHGLPGKVASDLWSAGAVAVMNAKNFSVCSKSKSRKTV